MSKIETAFQSKTDVTVPYRWIWEEVDDYEQMTDEEIREYIRGGAIGDHVYDQFVAESDNDISYENFIAESDFDDAVEAAIAERDNQRKMATLNAVVTVSEAADEYGVSEQAVRHAADMGWIVARQSAKTWLMLRADAEKRWKK